MLNPEYTMFVFRASIRTWVPAAIRNMAGSQGNGALGDRALPRNHSQTGSLRGRAGSPSTPLRSRAGHIANCCGASAIVDAAIAFVRKSPVTVTSVSTGSREARRKPRDPRGLRKHACIAWGRGASAPPRVRGGSLAVPGGAPQARMQSLGARSFRSAPNASAEPRGPRGAPQACMKSRKHQKENGGPPKRSAVCF